MWILIRDYDDVLKVLKVWFFVILGRVKKVWFFVILLMWLNLSLKTMWTSGSDGTSNDKNKFNNIIKRYLASEGPYHRVGSRAKTVIPGSGGPPKCYTDWLTPGRPFLMRSNFVRASLRAVWYVLSTGSEARVASVTRWCECWRAERTIKLDEEERFRVTAKLWDRTRAMERCVFKPTRDSASCPQSMNKEKKNIFFFMTGVLCELYERSSLAWSNAETARWRTSTGP